MFVRKALLANTMLQKRSISFVFALVSPKGKWYDNSVDDQ
jgi:hypothetical protein